ncbi:pentapeptide repeat-containing protein [Spirosoma taeanense]|uniref:Pentapeptide repeat-containing protein n=1 Tax=Spirosoma taeanense TaxID=2735870 RepID=A0A6M5Y9R5_9BACT|nr:pentapeptide repeat-containing protein [Spirosoma taeanense]QJW90695.1 pentapeptide repeat-containing protein [Spirosoma taeanense]
MEYYRQVFSSSGEPVASWHGHAFEQCQFRKLDLTRTALTGSSFVDCRFEDCNLTGVELKNTKLYDVQFTACRLLHVDFGVCDAFGFHTNFQDCQLDYTVFLNRKLRKANFTDCSLKEAHFLKCDLTATVFKNCNLELARFEDNNLTQVDFATSYNLTIDPDDNKVKKARFSLYSLPGLLTKYDLVVMQ